MPASSAVTHEVGDGRAITPAPDRRLPTWAGLLFVVLIGINVRAVFGVTPPLLPLISSDLDLSATAASLLTALPVLGMAFSAPLGHRLAATWGPDRAMLALMSALGVVELSRFAIGTAMPLILTAALIGAALGALSTLTPAFIAHHLPTRRGLGTGVYSTAMALGVAFAAWISPPLANGSGGWRLALAWWGLCALALTASLWLLRVKGFGMGQAPAGTVRITLPLREPRAWFVTACYAVPMVLGFGVISWLPSLLVESGISLSRATTLLVVFQSIQLVSILGLTPLTDRSSGRRGVFAAVMVTATVGIAMLTFMPTTWTLLGILLAGFGIGGGSSLALVKVQDESHTPLDATRLGAMAMLFSFLAGAASPFFMGVLADATGSLVPGFIFCLVVSIASLLLLIRMPPGPEPGSRVPAVAPVAA